MAHLGRDVKVGLEHVPVLLGRDFADAEFVARQSRLHAQVNHDAQGLSVLDQPLALLATLDKVREGEEVLHHYEDEESQDEGELR